VTCMGVVETSIGDRLASPMDAWTSPKHVETSLGDTLASPIDGKTSPIAVETCLGSRS
jgi:hypothetical protein